ncbi:TPA: chemotaxis protein CheA [bacterium]|nr:chemotaxis protein CheA [bacterium]
MSELIKKIEEISIAFVMADMSDLQTFADIYKKFNDFSDIAKNESQDALVKIVSALSKLIEKIILNEVTDKASAIDAISQTIGIIQSIVVNQRKLNEVKFPDEIGISLSEIINNDSNTMESNENILSSEKADDVNEMNQSEQNSSNSNLGASLFGDASLIADFIGESREHLHEADVQLLVLENDPNNEDALNAVYRAFHTIKGVAGFLNLTEISTLAHATEDLLDRARKGEITFIGTPIDVTFSSVDSLKQMIDDVEKALSSGNLTYNIKLDELIDSIKKAVSKEEKITDKVEIKDVQENNISTENIEINDKQILEDKTELINETKEKEYVQEIKNVISAFDKEDNQEKQVTKTSSSNVVKETLKIEAERLDRLVDMIGELVIAESMVTQDFEIISRASARVARNLTHLNKITRELQEIGMSLRMMPVKPVFERMARLARDLAKKSGKKVEFSMSGEDTEIDKSVVEKISDPLTHMIRNAVDHGIESDINDRIKLGKSEVGHIKISAFHKSGDIIIEVEDDGKGLDKDAILEKAKEKGIISDGQIMTEQEIYNLIFMPGFSTAKIVTDVSGRGVGMDVVNRNIQSLRGQIEIHSSRGKGTIFTLRLPLTLAIMDGIIVQVGTEQYIIPTLSVVESIRPKYEEISTIMGNAEMLSVRGKLLPMFRVSSLFQVNDAIQDPTEALIVIVEDEGKQVGFMVDNLVGHQQIVIKSLGDSFNNIKGISGGAIMADGRVGLILDVSGIVKLAVSGTINEMAA